VGDSATQAQPVEIVKTEPVKRKSVDAVDHDLAVRKQALFAKFKTESPASAKHVMFAGLNNMESSASRINAASQSYKLKNTGNDIVDALVNTLNTDPNANVRLAALDGLGRFYRDDYVRKKLMASLKKQQDPLVQIALIDLLTRMRESGILSELEKIVNDENTQKAVKDCAYSGIIQLRSS
jgi:HEAT repeat protein